MHPFLATYQRLFDARKWRTLHAHVERQLRESGPDAYLLCLLSETLYQQGEYKAALRAARKAARAPGGRYPDVGWHAASALEALKRNREAIGEYEAILKRGARELATHINDPNRANIARNLVSECRLGIAENLVAMGEDAAARKWYRAHLRHRKPSRWNQCDRRTVEKRLAATEERLRLGKDARRS